MHGIIRATIEAMYIAIDMREYVRICFVCFLCVCVSALDSSRGVPRLCG